MNPKNQKNQKNKKLTNARIRAIATGEDHMNDLLRRSLQFVGLDTTYAEFKETIESVNVYRIIYVDGFNTFEAAVSNTDVADLEEIKKRSIVSTRHNKR